MVISFANKALRELCEDASRAEQELGETAMRQLIQRLADLNAATDLADVIAGNPRSINQTEFAVDLAASFMLTLTCSELKPPRMHDGSIDWLKVRRVKLVAISLVS